MLFTLLFAACAGIPAGQIGKDSSPDDILSWWNGIGTGSSILLGRIYGIDAFLERVKKWIASPNKKVTDLINFKTLAAALGSSIVGSVYAHKFGKALNIFSKGGYYPFPQSLTNTLDFALGGMSTFILYIDRVSSLPEALRTSWRTRFSSGDTSLKPKIMFGVDLVCGLSSGLTGVGLLQSSTADPAFVLNKLLPPNSIQTTVAGYLGGAAVGGLNAAVSLRSYHGAPSTESLSGAAQNYMIIGYNFTTGSFDSIKVVTHPESQPAPHPSSVIPKDYARHPSCLLSPPPSPSRGLSLEAEDDLGKGLGTSAVTSVSRRLIDSP